MVAESNKTYYVLGKRMIDLVLSSIALVIATPFMLFFCVLIRIESKGCPIYVQQRVGLQGKVFNIYKLRSMYLDAEEGGPKWADADDDRVTRVGKFVRKTRMDELPQLINIIKGDMCIIGPRPERPYFIEEFLKEIPVFNERLAVKPGLTGYAQVNGGYEVTPENKLKYDLYYIDNQSFKLDCWIILMTVKVVFTGNGAR